MKDLRKKKQAFSLIELLIVIAILGVLSAIVLVILNPQRWVQDARNGTRITDLQTIQNAINRYLTESPDKKINDFTGYSTLYSSAIAASNPTGNCPDGVNGNNLNSVNGSYSLETSDTTNVMNVSILVNKTYISKLLKDPATGNTYKACIDTQNNNLLIIFAPDTEIGSSEIPIKSMSVGRFGP